MPHKCDSCKEVFEDGNKAILEGCPNCNGKKFQYLSSRTQTVEEAETTEATTNQQSHSPDGEPAVATASTGTSTGDEYSQSDLQDTDGLEDLVIPDGNEEEQVLDPLERFDTPDNTQELREELNEQFESIRIIEPGRYELNLRKMFEGQDFVIQLEEDGKFVIQLDE